MVDACSHMAHRVGYDPTKARVKAGPRHQTNTVHNQGQPDEPSDCIGRRAETYLATSSGVEPLSIRVDSADSHHATSHIW